jgi:NAD(P)-dependent dehydrogenase (short-subunit alcohol dehydrogenase family)
LALGELLNGQGQACCNHAGGRIINVTSSLGQLGPDDTKYGGMPSTTYRTAIAGATLQQLRDIGFDGNDPGMRDAMHAKYPCPAYRATKAMLNKVQP